jgi:hypothetical protein
MKIKILVQQSCILVVNTVWFYYDAWSKKNIRKSFNISYQLQLHEPQCVGFEPCMITRLIPLFECFVTGSKKLQWDHKIGKSAGTNFHRNHKCTHKILSSSIIPHFTQNSTINVVSMKINWFTFISKFYIPEFCIILDLNHFLYGLNQMPTRFYAIVGGPHQNLTSWFYCIISQFSRDSCLLDNFT